MGKKKYPLLDRNEIESILSKLAFSVKKTKGSHAQWEGYTNGKRRLVTVGHLKSKTEKYSRGLLNKMIQQSGLSKEDFYSCL